MKNTKELRNFLAETMEMARNGDISPGDGRNIVGMANQITISMNTELKKQKLDLDLGRKTEAFGAMKL
jgi:hypothetical protein